MSAGLNDAQRAAIHYLDGPLLVLAGAGSGKTRVITHKLCWLIEHCGLNPAHLAAITFTNKAAREMRERIDQMLGRGLGKGLTISTFHALGVRIIRTEHAACGLKPQFSILDAGDALQIVTDAAGEADKGIAKAIQWQISSWKNALIDPAAALAAADQELHLAAARAYAEYERILRAYQAVDFDDLIALPVQLFERDREARERWQNRLRYLLVDEYQDTNRAQYRLLRLITGVRAAFTAVGDDDQAIYGWRGADIENLAQLGRDYPRLKVIKLEQNYRSTTAILEAANTVIGHNPKLHDKRLWSALGRGERPRVTACKSPEAEAERVALRLAALHVRGQARWRDCAVLYRSNHQARLIETQLRSQQIPYVISGGQSFFDRAELRDVLAYLRLLVNEDDDLAFIRALTTPRRGAGATTLETLGQFAGEHHLSLFAAVTHPALAELLGGKPLGVLQTFVAYLHELRRRAAREPAGALLGSLVATIGYEAWLYDHHEPRDAETRWRNVCDFVAWVSRRSDEDGRDLIAMTQNIALMSLLDKEDPDFDGVQLATLHAAKGLEFPHVFMIGVEEGILPHQNSIDDDKIDEERRLMYVGITRAQRQLDISWCERRKQGRDSRNCEPSRFIAEMGEHADIAPRGAPVALGRDAGRERLAALRAMLDKP